MKRRKQITAQELMDDLDSDPEWRAMREERQRKREERKAALEADESGLVGELRAAGFDIDSVWDFVNSTPNPYWEQRFIGEYPAAYPLLIQHLDVPHLARVREGIIRALTVKDGGPDLERALLTQFRLEQDPNLRWVLANALQTAVPYHRRRKHPEIAAVLANSREGG